MAEVKIDRQRDKKQKLIINDFTQVAPDRNRKDMATLKQAVERAESVFCKNRYRLYDLYHDIITIDGHLSGIIQKRKDFVLNKKIRFIDKTNTKVDAFDTLIYSAKFNSLLNVLLDSKFWGISGFEFIPGKEFDFVEIPRKHIRPEDGLLVKSQYDNAGMPIADFPFVWTVGKKDDLGLLLKCSMYALYKRSGIGDFAQYVEIFGQPVRIITYDAYDTQTKNELDKILKESGGALTMMIPKQAQFQMLDGKTSNGTGELQERLIKNCNSEMSIAILGNTETTNSSTSSGYAQAKVQGDQQMEIVKSDISFVENTLNDASFLKILASYGFPVEAGSFEFELELDVVALKARLEIDEKVSLKVPVDDDYWYMTYGIPKPDNYEQLKAEQIEAQKPVSVPAPDSVKSEKESKNLLERLTGFFAQAPHKRGAVLEY